MSLHSFTHPRSTTLETPLALFVLAGCRTTEQEAAALPTGAATGPLVPAADHHQHLFSPAVEAMFAAESVEFPPVTARDVVAHLDSAGVRRALVLAVAYLYDSPDRTVAVPACSGFGASDVARQHDGADDAGPEEEAFETGQGHLRRMAEVDLAEEAAEGVELEAGVGERAAQ